MSSSRSRCLTASVSILAASPACRRSVRLQHRRPRRPDRHRVAPRHRRRARGRIGRRLRSRPARPRITGATFTGLLTGGVAAPTVGDVVVEIYRVFPNDSDTDARPVRPRSRPRKCRRASIRRPTSPSTSRDSSLVGELHVLDHGAQQQLHRRQLGAERRHPPDAERVHRRRRRRHRAGGAVQHLVRQRAGPARRPLLLRPAGPGERTAISSGCRRRGRSCRRARPSRPDPPTCRAGSATERSIPTGCASAPTSPTRDRSTRRSR